MAWKRIFQRRHAGIWFGLITLLLVLVAPAFPATVESLYSRGLYPILRKPLEGLSWLVPLPMTYVLATGLLVGIVWRVRKRLLRRPPKTSRRFVHLFHRIFTVFSVIFGLFYWLWGFNYFRQPITTSLDLSPQAPAIETLVTTARKAALEAGQWRAQIPDVGPDTLTAQHLPAALTDSLQASYDRLLPKYHFSTAYVRPRLIRPGGWLLRFNVAGIYNPFVGEGNVSAALTAPQIPFTMAHEMAHGMGFGDEGTCNFWGLLATSQSQDPVVRYSSAFMRYRYFANELARRAPDELPCIVDSLDPGFRMDLIATRNNGRRYDGRLRKVGSQVNDTYLRAQGVEGGVDSYNRVVILWLAWAEKFR